MAKHPKSDEVNAELAKLGLSIVATFVPWSQSRNKGEKQRSLNWSIEVIKTSPLNGLPLSVLKTDYMAGMAHCPSYQQHLTVKDQYANRLAIEHETEKGTVARYMASVDRISAGSAILPDPADVFYSLVMDSEAIDYATFEDWADNLGYDTDSRSAEKIYRACLEIGLALRAAIRGAGLETLRNLFQDY